MTRLARMTIYPIKSLSGVDVTKSEVLPSGGLRNDRRWAIVDEEGRFVNGKRTAAVHAIRAEYDSGLNSVTLSHPAMPSGDFSFDDGQPALSEWLSKALQLKCKLIENLETGFPDDLEAPGPTIVSSGTLEEVACWFSISPEEAHRRFRANLVIEASEPFWEDRLVGEIGSPVPFTIGNIAWLGVNPCQRCVVPSRDSLTGVPQLGFQREFAKRREATLPAWAPRERFDHFYRLTVNTKLAKSDGHDLSLRIGDELHHLAPRSVPH